MGKKVIKLSPNFLPSTWIAGAEHKLFVSRGKTFNKPWFDAAILNSAATDDMKSMNGIAWTANGQPNRVLKADFCIKVAWRGMRQGQTYKHE